MADFALRKSAEVAFQTSAQPPQKTLKPAEILAEVVAEVSAEVAEVGASNPQKTVRRFAEVEAGNPLKGISPPPSAAAALDGGAKVTLPTPEGWKPKRGKLYRIGWQDYRFEGSVPHEGLNGPTTLLCWTSHCTECGEQFDLRSPVRISSTLNVRCAAHRKPGKASSKGARAAQLKIRRKGKRHVG